MRVNYPPPAAAQLLGTPLDRATFWNKHAWEREQTRAVRSLETPLTQNRCSQAPQKRTARQVMATGLMATRPASRQLPEVERDSSSHSTHKQQKGLRVAAAQRCGGRRRARRSGRRSALCARGDSMHMGAPKRANRPLGHARSSRLELQRRGRIPHGVTQLGAKAQSQHFVNSPGS